ncbi:MAG: hypothetical protein Q9187_006799, partial [Circinaria calcarea]
MADAPCASATANLAADHVISGRIEEAREEYPTRLPPFIQRQIACAPGRRLAVFRATESSGPPKTDRVKKVDLVCRSWDNNHKFWTYHNGDDHCIVKGFAGEYEEWITFHVWHDREEGFGKRRVAYLKRNEVTVPFIFDTSQELPAFSTSGYDDGHDDSMLCADQPRNFSGNTRIEDLDGSETALPSWLRGQDAREIWEHPSKVSTAIGSGCTTCVHLQQQCIIAPGHDSCAYCSAKGAGYVLRCSLNPRRFSNTRSRISRKKETPVDKIINKPLKRGRNSSTPDLVAEPVRKPRHLQRGTRRQSSSSSSSSSSPSPSLSSTSPLMDVSFNNPFPNLRRSTNPEHQLSVPAQAPEPSVPPPTPQNAPMPLPTAPPSPNQAHSLAPHILANTTVHISLSTNSYGAVPLLLRDCVTLDAFFDVIVAAWEISEKDIAAVV